jgi:hypothetical protein
MSFGFGERVPSKPEQMLSLSGELLVAGELLRREFPVLLTFGEGKKWAVVVKTEKKLFDVAVVTARDPQWDISRVRGGGDDLIVFVLIPREYAQPPEYFVLTKGELIQDIVEPRERAANNGQKRSWMPGWSLSQLTVDDLKPYRGDWDKIAVATGLPRRDWTGAPPSE